MPRNRNNRYTPPYLILMYNHKKSYGGANHPQPVETLGRLVKCRCRVYLDEVQPPFRIMKKLLFILPLLLIPIFVTTPASAVSVTPLCSFTFDSSNQINGSTQYCDNFLSAIKYVEFDFGVDSDTNSMSVTYNTRSYNNQGGRSYYLIGFTSLPYSYISAGNGYSDTYPITVNFYSEQPGPAPEPCPEPEPCECDECDVPFIVGLFKQGFWGVATAVVSLIVPIVALFLVFRLIHDFFWGRS